MDLQLYLRVLWRFRLLVAAGIVLASLLAFLAVVRVSFDDGVSISYREDEQWVSRSMLFVTQEGFPWGRLTFDDPRTQSEVAKSRAEKFADPNRFSSLAVLYAHLATSDPVRDLIRADGPLDGEIEAAPVLASDNPFAAALPLIYVAAITESERAAIHLSVRATDAFRAFLAREQERNAIPPSDRVKVTVVRRPRKAELMAGRSMTLPMVVFLAVASMAVGLAFILENLRPRVRAVAGEQANRGTDEADERGQAGEPRLDELEELPVAEDARVVAFPVDHRRDDPPAEQVTVVRRPRKAELAAGWPVTVPMVASLAVASMAMRLVLLLENLRPSGRAVPGEQEQARRRAA